MRKKVTKSNNRNHHRSPAVGVDWLCDGSHLPGCNLRPLGHLPL